VRTTLRVRLPLKLLTLAVIATLNGQELMNGPLHDSGQSVTGSFEGWYRNPDGTFSLLFGYYNRNQKQELDLQAGPDNNIMPGGPDRGQPTHFLPGRQWGVFTITVPADFGSQKLVWNLTANGVHTAVPGKLNPLWEVSPFEDATENTPPFIAFHSQGPFGQGPGGQRSMITATSGKPAPLEVWVADDARVTPGATRPKTPPVTLKWSLFRGPSPVVFENPTPPVEPAEFAAPQGTSFHGRAATTATFNEPGDYVLRAVANDWSGDGGRGFQCCWTNAQLRVSVTKASQ
jgi:hypothetical protein